jgi:hypothetical protein
MNGDYLLAERLIELFRNEANMMENVGDKSTNDKFAIANLVASASYRRIANSIQQLLDEYNPPKPKDK